MSRIQLPLRSYRVSLGSKSRGWQATFARSVTLSSRCTCQLSATRLRRSWLPPIPTLLRFAQRSRWPYFRMNGAAAEEIQRRRDDIGFSYVVVGAAFADALAPVVAKLAGR